MPWTPEQVWALQTDRHAVVTASAGSGKTAVLVERYVRLLLSGVEPTAIVAITFTRKAAAEMYARIAAELERRIAAATTPEELARLKPLRERLSGAQISTIHSFCAQLLRRFPVEAGVLPNFTELTQAEADRLLYEVAQNVFEELLGGEQAAEVWRFVREYGRREALRLVTEVCRNVERFVLLRSVLERPRAERLQQGRERFWQLVGEMLASVIEQLREAAERVLTAAQHRESEYAAELRRLCQTGGELLAGGVSTAQEQLFELWQQIRQHAFRRDGTPRAWLAVEEPEAWRLARRVAVLDRFAAAWQERDEDEPLLASMEVLARIADAVLEQLEAEKRARNVLDFSDLQIKALQLLQQPAVVERLRRDIRYLLVDEFQDTNPVQYALVQRLLALGEEGWIGPHVFLVGDPKQSIYGFRDADVRVFERARQELLERNGWARRRGLLPRHPEPAADSGDIHLPVSFRLAPELVAFVNRVAGQLFPHTPEQVPYEPLVCGRPWARGSVRFLLAVEAVQERTRVSEMSEEELLARALRCWVDGPEPLTVMEWDATTGSPRTRPVRYGDIAILARYRLDVPRLTAMLQQYGIPYLVHAGAGFFQTPEVQDLYFLLRFLLNERDDYALAVALRSPLFALPDGELLQMSFEEGQTLWERLCRRSRQRADAQLCWIVQTLELLRLVAPRQSLAELLRTIAERTLWLVRLRHSPRSTQIRANVQKLLDFARTFQARGFRTLADFVQELEALIETEIPETEAVLPAGMDAVNVLTIHAAKGLEFPVVVLYRMAATRDKPEVVFFDEQLGILARRRRWDEEAGIWQPIETPASVLARFLEDARQQAEEQRVLYVGLTRARDHLVLSATLTVRKDGTVSFPQGLFGFVLDSLGIAPEHLLEESAFELSEELELDTNGQRWRECLRLRVPIVRSLPIAEVRESRQLEHRPVLPLLQPIPVQWSAERLSATQYALFRLDPESFLRRAVLGFPATPEELLSGAVIARDTERELPDPLVLGQLLHQLLAHVTLWTTEAGEVLSDRLHALARALVEQSPYASAADAMEWLCERAAAVVTTPFLQQRWGAFWRALREYTLTVPLGENFLTGTLDVLLPTDEGWEIWDWKLGAAGAAELSELARPYEPQLRVYAYLVSRRFPEQHRLCARLLFIEAARADVPEERWVWSACWERHEVMAWEEEFRTVAERLFVLQ
ncbi:ATP-dependent helicase/nuclease subunit A [bacterium HR21]|nr:ATP-dependent helicase/nuclease subunit A [bacterium HR21]